MSDDEDLAELRRIRNAGGGRPQLDGPLGDKLSELRRRATASSAARDDFYEDPKAQHGPSRPPAFGGGPSRASREESEDADADDNLPSIQAPPEEVDLDMDLRQQLPLSFGATQKAPAKPLQEVIAQTKRQTTADEVAVHGPARPPPAGEEEGSDEDDSEEEREPRSEDPYHLPVTHEVVLKGHSRLVSCLDVEHSGSRLVTGGYDYAVRLYDFNGMKRDLRPFRELEPCGAHQIRAVSWSPSGDNFFVVPNSTQPKLFDRDGRELGEFGKGDMYIRDLRHTKGHIMGCTSGQWHPHEKNTTLTASEDGSLRLWDVTYVSKEGGMLSSRCQVSVIKPNQTKPGRQSVTACCFSPDGKIIAGGISDGSIQMWSAHSNFSSAAVGQVLPPKQQLHLQNHWTYSTKTTGMFKAAHPADEEVTCLRFSRDGNTLLSRCTDGTLKLWDIRNPKAPLRQTAGLETSNSQAMAVFSPDESLIMTGVSATREGASGAVCFFKTATLEFVRKLGVPTGSAVALAWHPKLNQIFVGSGDKKEGAPRILYDPDFSERGAMLAVARAPRLKDASDLVARLPVPAEFEERKGGGTRKRQRDAQVEKQRNHRIPQPPQGQFGVGGALGKGTGGSLLTQYLLKERGMLNPRAGEGDVRAAILKHAEAASNDPKYVESCYTDTQPGRIFAEEEAAESDEEPEEHQ